LIRAGRETNHESKTKREPARDGSETEASQLQYQLQNPKGAGNKPDNEQHTDFNVSCSKKLGAGVGGMLR